MIEIVIGTSNPGKVSEVQRFLGDLPVRWRPVSERELGITIDETADTFEGNSEIKARAFLQATNQPVIVADGGLEVPALGNWPGVRSRRLDTGHHHTDDELIAAFQAKLATIPVEQRQYRFVAAWSFAIPGGTVTTARGEHTGELAWKLHPQPVPGMPYRRFFRIPQFNKYFLDLTDEEYTSINHNRIALDQLRPVIETYLKEAHA